MAEEKKVEEVEEKTVKTPVKTSEKKEEKKEVVKTVKTPVVEEEDEEEDIEASALDNRAFDTWLPEKEDKEDKEDKDKKEADEEFDYKDIDPETDWACYGQIEPEHFECKECQFRESCAKKSGVKL